MTKGRGVGVELGREETCAPRTDQSTKMWRKVAIVALLVGICAARPLQWFAEEEEAVDYHKDVPKDLAFAMERVSTAYHLYTGHGTIQVHKALRIH